MIFCLRGFEQRYSPVFLAVVEERRRPGIAELSVRSGNPQMEKGQGNVTPALPTCSQSGLADDSWDQLQKELEATLSRQARR